MPWTFRRAGMQIAMDKTPNGSLHSSPRTAASYLGGSGESPASL